MKEPIMPYEQIIQAHKSGEIDLAEMNGDDIAKKFGCSSSTVSVARRKLNVVKMTTWRKLLNAHEAGEIDLVNWTFDKIVEKFGCSRGSVVTAIKHGKLDHVYSRGPAGASLKMKDDAETRAYWDEFSEHYGVFKKWGVIPERVGLTKNQWLRRHEDRA